MLPDIPKTVAPIRAESSSVHSISRRYFKSRLPLNENHITVQHRVIYRGPHGNLLKSNQCIPTKQPINPPSLITNSRSCRASVQSKVSSKSAKIIGVEQLHPEIPEDTFRRFPGNSAIRTPKCVLIPFQETDFINCATLCPHTPLLSLIADSRSCNVPVSNQKTPPKLQRSSVPNDFIHKSLKTDSGDFRETRQLGHRNAS
ncbi:hypothetical protein CEXT_479481 [Caerostris extrusa]|uniref:Uncharacterized protein n=1 Tax=Caerostris extrusa TaxID=172846 RepID=A0AAV4MIN2_CAEEX|nr:hypothetical protein CEXT_479481 [Caerostris extrusa]